MTFLALSGKIIFLFPENMILFFGWKMKNDSWKKYMEMWDFLQVFWKDNLSKKLALEYNLSSIIRKDDISISRKYDLILYLLTWNWYVQIFLYNCKLRFFQIKFVQVCAPQNDGNSITTRLTKATKNIINWSISFFRES